MSEFIEKLARALHERPRKITELLGPWDGLSEDIKEIYRGDVRAVLAAAREPSDRMVEAGLGAMHDSGARDVDEIGAGIMTNVLQAAIDAALK